MSLCINPHCSKPDNSDNILFCQSCGSELLLEGRYRATKLLGRGGFGQTYEVSDARRNIPKVLKILINNQPKAVELFQREAEVLKTLNHPGIPKVEEDDYFVYLPRSQQPLHCLVMEKIEGMDLYRYLEKRDGRPINQKLAVQWLKEIVTILHLVHERKYFHRDIKPPNIMLGAKGNLVLIDFGAARQATRTYYVAHQKGNVTGVISVGYTPSEQINGQAIPQSDFFALGRTFVFLLTGKEPNDPAIFDSYNDRVDWRDKVPEISPKFADLIDRMMARSPSQRPANTKEILQGLAEVEQVVNPSRKSSQSKRSIPPLSQLPPTEVNPQTPTSDPTTPKKNIGLGFWWWWLLANLAGFLSFGMLLPVTQWLVLRGRVHSLPKTAWWVLVTAVGIVSGVFVLMIMADFIGSSDAMVVFTLGAIGGVLGTIQWLLLRQWISQASSWILVNAIAGVMSAVVGNTLDDVGYDTFLVWFAVLTIFSGITGFALMQLLKNPISKS
ncbi:protein kinase domain-containing protein [Mastigocoleus testarum]|uniref:protein kinase domain-containing protein n=1 Tax=Mastigocoleus testarum TaxID=996925 RepID=UPI00040CB911|nr:serine/threonine-protein kinase [Mastigocoleus testarum]